MFEILRNPDFLERLQTTRNTDENNISNHCVRGASGKAPYTPQP
jgi:hypothetical protein